MAPRPKKNNLTFVSPQNVEPFLFRPVTCFFNNGTLRGLLAHNLASHRRLLTVTVLTGNFRSSLITLELIIESLPFWLFFDPFEWWFSVFFHIFLVLVAILKHWRSFKLSSLSFSALLCMTNLRWHSSKMQPHWVSTLTYVETIDFKLYAIFLNCVDKPSKTKVMIQYLQHAFSGILLACLMQKEIVKMGYSQESVHNQEVLWSKKHVTPSFLLVEKCTTSTIHRILWQC